MPRLSNIDKLILKAKKKNRGKNKKWVRYCPKCNSRDVVLRADMEAVWYSCRKCLYRAPSFPEKARK